MAHSIGKRGKIIRQLFTIFYMKWMALSSRRSWIWMLRRWRRVSRLVCPMLFFSKHLSLVRPKNYENGHEDIFGLSVVIESKVKNSKILTVKVIFLCQESTKSFSTFFFIEEYKMEGNFWYCYILITSIFNVVVVLKEDNWKAKNIFMAIFVVVWPYLLTTKLRCSQKNNIGHTNLDVDSPKINPGVSLRVGGSMVDKRSEKSKKIL